MPWLHQLHVKFFFCFNHWENNFECPLTHRMDRGSLNHYLMLYYRWWYAFSLWLSCYRRREERGAFRESGLQMGSKEVCWHGGQAEVKLSGSSATVVLSCPSSCYVNLLFQLCMEHLVSQEIMVMQISASNALLKPWSVGGTSESKPAVLLHPLQKLTTPWQHWLRFLADWSPTRDKHWKNISQREWERESKFGSWECSRVSPLQLASVAIPIWPNPFPHLRPKNSMIVQHAPLLSLLN